MDLHPLPSPSAPSASPRARTLRLLWFIAAFLVAATGISLLYSLSTAETAFERLQLASARAFFRSTVAIRSWNARHGGVYVPVTQDFQPNPYLDDPLRDVVTTDGLRLTKVNPAYMTRLLAGLEQEQAGVRLHLTSLRPIRPQNRPDPWEAAALRRFEEGQTEAYTVVESGTSPELRYMAPLRTERPCLRCHAKQGYREGDIRGGISVTLPFGPFRAAAAAHRRQHLLVHGGFLLVALGGVLFLGRGLLRAVEDLQAARAQVRTLEGLLPICCHCKKIRREGGAEADPKSWVPVEGYIQERSEATFSHGICPDCLEKHYPQVGQR